MWPAQETEFDTPELTPTFKDTVFVSKKIFRLEIKSINILRPKVTKITIRSFVNFDLRKREFRGYNRLPKRPLTHN